jgi:hypothetical protein
MERAAAEPADGPADGARVRWARALERAARVGLSTRVAVLLVGYLAVVMIGYVPGKSPRDLDGLGPTPVRHFDSELLNLPYRWDAGWYVGIAMDGYQFTPQAPVTDTQRIVFFPAFPFAIRFVAHLFGRRPAAFFLGGVALSTTVFVFALMYLDRFATAHIGSDRAGAALWLLACYPFSLFYGAIYTEGLFLLAALGAFHHLARGQLVRGAAFGLLLGLTKPNGFLVAVPLALVALKEDFGPGVRFRGDRLAVAAAPLVGMAVYSAAVFMMTGDPFMWARGQGAWGRQLPGVTELLRQPVSVLKLSTDPSLVGFDLLNGTGLIFGAATIWPVARRLGWEYAAFIAVILVPPLVAGGVMSQGRFSSVLFPSFVWAASVLPRRALPGAISACAMLQALCASLFYTWRLLY